MPIPKPVTYEMTVIPIQRKMRKNKNKRMSSTKDKFVEFKKPCFSDNTYVLPVFHLLDVILSIK